MYFCNNTLNNMQHFHVLHSPALLNAVQCSKGRARCWIDIGISVAGSPLTATTALADGRMSFTDENRENKANSGVDDERWHL